MCVTAVSAHVQVRLRSGTHQPVSSDLRNVFDRNRAVEILVAVNWNHYSEVGHSCCTLMSCNLNPTVRK